MFLSSGAFLFSGDAACELPGRWALRANDDSNVGGIVCRGGNLDQSRLVLIPKKAHDCKSDALCGRGRVAPRAMMTQAGARADGA